MKLAAHRLRSSQRISAAVTLAAAILLTTNTLAAAPSPAAKGTPTYEADIRPILKANCFQCHGEGEKLKGGLDLRLRKLIAKGGESGAAIVPGKPDKSLLFKQVASGEMPRAEKKLTPEQVALIGRWIAAGAKTEKPEPAQLADGYHFTEAEKKFWAFQPVKRPAVPQTPNTKHQTRNPIDNFLIAKLAEKKLSFSPEADRATLVRRVAFDLTGLPPTPEEVARFAGSANESDKSYESMVDHFLASPAYGERWGRHWLDVAGYADSEGYNEADLVRQWAWKYRDYVIKSLNDDKPFDQFIREQLAGDEMLKPPYKNLDAAAVEKLTATGFLRMVPDGTASAGVEQKLARNAVVADVIKVVSTSLMGMTVGCAQCHDHRYDPIPQADYYRLRAVFEPALDTKNWRTPPARLVSLQHDADRAKAAEIEKEAKVIETARLAKQEEFISEVLEKELLKRPEELRAPLREAYKAAAARRTAAQTKMLKEHPTVGQLSPGSLYLYEQKKADELTKLTDEANKIRTRKPPEEFIPTLTEPPGASNVLTVVFHRGDPDQPKQTVKPGDLTVLASWRPVDLPEKDTSRPTTGRRLAFAKELTDGSHPLTARVLVNRVWMHHFGRGIVGSAGDFGFLGERPSHPELLDWLASEFVAQGWSLKKLHKLIMTSAAYRQASVAADVRRLTPNSKPETRNAKQSQSLLTSAATGQLADPDNRLLWHFPLRRVEAEALRDAMLAVSGKLNPKQGGAPVPIMTDETGQVVVGVNTDDTAGRPSGRFVPLNGEEFRRSLYVQVRRTKPVGLMETFDAPRMEPNCDSRNASTVAPQSLALMNGEFAVAQSKFFAERVVKEAGDSPDAQVKRAWQLAFARTPSGAELKDSLAFLATQLEHFTKQADEKAAAPATPAPAAKAAPTKAAPAPKAAPATKGKEPPPIGANALALATFCQALLTSNRFLYVD